MLRWWDFDSNWTEYKKISYRDLKPSASLIEEWSACFLLQTLLLKRADYITTLMIGLVEAAIIPLFLQNIFSLACKPQAIHAEIRTAGSRSPFSLCISAAFGSVGSVKHLSTCQLHTMVLSSACCEIWSGGGSMNWIQTRPPSCTFVTILMFNIAYWTYEHCSKRHTFFLIHTWLHKKGGFVIYNEDFQP